MSERHDVPDELPPDDGEGAAAVDAAQQLLLGPTVAVPRDLLIALLGELEAAGRLVQRVLDDHAAGG
jgi:hypothetical protein